MLFLHCAGTRIEAFEHKPTRLVEANFDVEQAADDFHRIGLARGFVITFAA
ncbi:MAG: hypothetical protein H6879_10040 [Rhodobiaceae bacterium]|nr:hypothetical protein [Rhodobiaceae bacterium]